MPITLEFVLIGRLSWLKKCPLVCSGSAWKYDTCLYVLVYLGSDLLGDYEGAETIWDPADACFKTSVRQELFAILKLN